MPPAICIRCLKSDRVSMDLDDAASFTCSSCKEAFTADEVRNLITDLHAAWDERLNWIDTGPWPKAG
jgi:hypothetical protein